jgi:hypothetical protein
MRNIEDAYKEVVGVAPDRRSLDAMMRAGRVMKLRDDDAFWLIIIALEAQHAGVTKALAEAKNLAEAAKAAGEDARRGADLIKKIVENGGPWLQKAVQDSAFGVSTELNKGIDDAVVRAFTKMLNDTHKVATDACSKINAAGGDAVEKIQEGVVRALNALDLARKSLEKEARQAGSATVDRWSKEVDRAIENKSEIERAAQWRRTILTIAVTMIVNLALSVGLWSLAQSSAYKNGYADGMQSSVDAKERYAWANTQEGKDAYLLAKIGVLGILMTCSNPGWVIEHRLCMPKAASDGFIVGWVLPPP